MAIGSGNSSPKNGLAFAYDMHNPKSWKGYPTINCARQLQDWHQKTRVSVTEITDGSIKPPSHIPNARVWKIESTDNTGNNLLRDSGYYGSGGWAGSEIPRNPDIIGDTATDYTPVGQGKFTYSLYAMGLPTNGSTSSSITIDIGDRNSVSATIGDGTNGWQLLETDDSAGIQNTTYPYDFFDVSMTPNTEANLGAYICAVQINRYPGTDPLTLPDYSVHPPWQEVGTTRSETDALVDLSGNHTITINSLTAEANNEFSFNGTSDFMTMDGGKANYEMKNKSYTVEAVIKLDALNRVNGIISDLQYAWWVFRIGSDNAFFARHKYSDVITGPQATSTTVFNSTDYYHVAATFEHGGGMKVFVNGVKEAETDSTLYRNLLGFNLDNRGLMYIGQDRSNAPGSPTYFQGKIPMLKIYNNYVMREIDVKKSFNAIRGRYGI